MCCVGDFLASSTLIPDVAMSNSLALPHRAVNPSYMNIDCVNPESQCGSHYEGILSTEQRLQHTQVLSLT